MQNRTHGKILSQEKIKVHLSCRIAHSRKVNQPIEVGNFTDTKGQAGKISSKKKYDDTSKNKKKKQGKQVIQRTRPDTRLVKSHVGGQRPYSRSQDHLDKSSKVQK